MAATEDTDSMRMWNPLPQSVGHYEIYHQHYLGQGTYGAVCVGKDTRDGSEVAIKRITPRYDISKYITEELQNLQTIEHRNVIKLLHFEQIEQHTFFVLERCDCDLQTFAYRNPSFQNLKSQVMQNCADAVQCLHDHEIIHRDLKPENVLMKESGGGSWVAKISDFGCSRRVPDGVGSGSFSATGGLGTTAWMAPEVIPSVSGHSRYSKPADVYSLGLLNLSVAHHQGPGNALEPWKEDGEYLGQRVSERQRLGKILHLPSISKEDDSREMQDLKRLILRMLHPLPGYRCKIQDVCRELERMGDAEEAPLPEPSGRGRRAEQYSDVVFNNILVDAGMSISNVHGDRQDTAAATELQSAALDSALLQDMNIRRDRLEVIKVSSLTIPLRGMINFGLGQNLDGLWLAAEFPDRLHYSKHSEGSMQEVWEEAMPAGHDWRCRKFISSQHVLLQSLSNQVSVYQRHNLQFVQQLLSPGYVCGLLDGGGDAVVGNHASPSSYTQGVRLYVSPATDLQHCATELQTPASSRYKMEDFLWASGIKGVGIAVTTDKSFVDLYKYSGELIQRVHLLGVSRRPSCTSSHVLVPVRTSPPMIQVLSWEGQLLQTLGPEELSLRDNEWCWSVSPLHDGKINVLVTDTTEQDYIHTYQIKGEEAKGP